LEAFADEAASTVERARLAEDADRSEALRRADELKTTILSSVSHDLRSPLTAIKAATGTLRDDAGDWNGEDRESLLATIESQTDALATTVNNLLAMSRLEAGAVTPLLEAIEVQPLLSEVLLNAAADLGDHPVTVNARPGLWVLADYGLLSQALKNLVQNAAKYSTSNGEVVLSAIPAGERMRICVSDGGPGIPPEDLLHVFEKFYRGHNTARTSGTGLGLSITRAIVNLCGGRISVTSGQTGTTFMIDLRMTVEPGH
jgi:two-component system sensor histidine kinase KdpD